MPMLGQASGGFTESSSALRILHVGVRNTVGILTDDAFEQTNPPLVTTAATISTTVDTSVLGVLSGSICFTRPDEGANYIGGPVEPGAPNEGFVKPLGLFINTAAGNAFENQPGPASGKGPYVSSQGTYASQLFETQSLVATGSLAEGADLTYVTGQELIASRNGYLMPRVNGDASLDTLDIATIAAEVANGATASTTLGILKMPADSAQTEIVFDQRV
ncbi:hypothetical protein N9917_00985 [Deltaproteobacteria bacterium]|nr:hypothetical protein [Deltaproteobacteria bacterium]